MALKTKVSGRIAKPVEVVFDAVVNPAQLERFFATGGASGPLVAGTTVTWKWHDYPEHSAPVKVVEIVPNARIVLAWQSADDAAEGTTFEPHDNQVTILFEQLDDGRTLVTITEEGWAETPKGIGATIGNTEGWTGMLAALKVWVEHGINLRKDFYR